MSLRKLPLAKAFAPPAAYRPDAPADALSRWSGVTAAAGGDNTISVLDVIGADPWSGGGVTAARVAGALRAIGRKEVTVQINSPGGDMFEGIAIYNLLREHTARVTVQVLGLAASAASLIAMAGDEIRMATGSSMMIHKPWGVVVGDDEDMTEAAGIFRSFGESMADIYQARTGRKRGDVLAIMAAETWLDAADAVAERFADTLDEQPAALASAATDGRATARKRLDAALARAGVQRVDRRRLISDFEAGPEPAAAIDEASIRQLVAAMRG